MPEQDSALPADRFINRELSWVDFNERVLSLAEDRSLPPLERAKFLAIFASGLDEFYMVRVAGLRQQRDAGLVSASPDGMTPRDQLSAVAREVAPLVQRHSRVFVHDVMPALAAAGVRIVRWGDLDTDERDRLGQLFKEDIFPVLTPLAVDPAHPFPYISNLSLNLAVIVWDEGSKKRHFARVKVPPLLPRFVPLDGERGFVPLEDLIAANLEQLFPGMEILEEHTFRVTRNTDLEVNDDGAEDLLEALEQELIRKRFSPAVRLEIEDTMPAYVLELLMRELDIEEEHVHSLPAPLDLAGLWTLHGIERPDLKDPPFQPAGHPALQLQEDQPSGMFAVIDKMDILVHHPYESFATSVQRLIEDAAVDPDVLAIKLTLYRTSGESPIASALIEAAEAGKQVVVVVELKARFDERANINWARTLEKTGCHVVYGLIGLKTHCKLCLIVRQTPAGLQRYVHVGTGNYNPHTARIYEDLGLFTSEPQLAGEINHLFNYLTGYSRQAHYQRLMVAPNGMRERVVELIRREAETSTPERPGHIAIKVNNLVDGSVIDALYEASRAGVQVDLVVRGICCLRPGVEGLSENVTARSILGRFLEHSRIFYFRNGGDEELYIGSADLMERNLDRRVEQLVAVTSEDIKHRLKHILELALADNSSAWELNAKGCWTKAVPEEGDAPIGLQHELMRMAREEDG